MLILSRKVDEKIKIGNDITLTIIEAAPLALYFDTTY